MFLIFFFIFFDILLYFGCWYMVNKVLVKAVFYFVSSSLMCINFMWYKQMLRQLWACKGERILNQPGSWMLCVYKLLLFLTIVREIYRRTDGKYRNLQPNSISMSKGVTLSRHSTSQNQLSLIYHVLQSILTQLH